MKKSAYPVVSGLVFLLVAAGHTIRALRGTNVLLGLHRIPIWASWVGAVAAVLLAMWAFSSRNR
jgi:uncharacterized membrane protein